MSVVSSMTMRHPSTIPPDFCTNSQAAFNEPPVAIKSSTSSTRWPSLIASCCISNTSLPYSSLYSTEIVSPGNLPRFRTGTQPIDNSDAIMKLKRKPRASRPTTASICGWCVRTWSSRSRFSTTHVSPSVSAVKMSLKEKRRVGWIMRWMKNNEKWAKTRRNISWWHWDAARAEWKVETKTLLNSLENDAGLWEVGILADLIPEMIQTILTLFVSQWHGLLRFCFCLWNADWVSQCANSWE